MALIILQCKTFQSFLAIADQNVKILKDPLIGQAARNSWMRQDVEHPRLASKENSLWTPFMFLIVSFRFWIRAIPPRTLQCYSLMLSYRLRIFWRIWEFENIIHFSFLKNLDLSFQAVSHWFQTLKQVLATFERFQKYSGNYIFKGTPVHILQSKPSMNVNWGVATDAQLLVPSPWFETVGLSPLAVSSQFADILKVRVVLFSSGWPHCWPFHEFFMVYGPRKLKKRRHDSEGWVEPSIHSSKKYSPFTLVDSKKYQIFSSFSFYVSLLSDSSKPRTKAAQ